MPGKDKLRVLIVGDVVGKSGSRALYVGLSSMIKRLKCELVVANGENADGGFGITPEICEQLFQAGIGVITSGNHIWQKKEILPLLQSDSRLLRPANYPSENPGHGYTVITADNLRVAVINLQGRTRLFPIDCPFKKAKELTAKLQNETPIILVDFHAEATEEKEAMGHFLDGKVSVVFGTHTHVQTADARILPGGTAYITDIGATGPVNSVIGFNSEISVQRSLTQMPLKPEVLDGPAAIAGILVDIDRTSGLSSHIETIYERAVV